MKTLKLIKMGCDFWDGDTSTNGSDIGNYRVMLAEPIVDKNGVLVEGDLGNGYKYRYTRKNGTPLKKGIIEHHIALSCDLQYYKDNDAVKNGCYSYNHRQQIFDYSELLYTKADILRFVNAITDGGYDSVIIEEHKNTKEINGYYYYNVEA